MYKVPGSKSGLAGLTRREIEFYRQECNFTPEEAQIFEMGVKDKTVVQVCFAMGMSESTVCRAIGRIRKKINKVENSIPG